MPLVDIHLIKGVWSEEQKREMMTATTDALVKIWGEPVRKMTWVRVLETEQGQWMIGGEVWDAATVARLRSGED
ncbi:MAG TPA: tautomerase family protein [Acidimicrobiales bacterium]|jgi:4-oxalocrotonate tautomerase